MSDSQSISERIKIYRDQKGYSAKAFEKLCGLSNAYLDKTENVGTKILERILNFCPDLNRDWVVNNRGEMIKNLAQDQEIRCTTQETSNQDEESYLKKLVVSYEKTIELQAAEITRLKEKIERLKRKVKEDTPEKIKKGGM
ncbi:MAG: hypothetical protein K0M50_17580 [Prolixibacteraceae bacterium]|nr:hypothetical protein [Prolixibacteraceae bacterium]